jgi:transposase
MKKEEKIVKKLSKLLRRINCPRYLHHFGPKKYKFLQHALALLLKEVFRLSFRRISRLLIMLGFNVPSYSALCKIRKRIPSWIWNSLLKSTIDFNEFSVAVDSTGFSTSNPSFHYVKRIDREKPVKSYVKLSSFFDIPHRKFTALRIRIKPRHDTKDINYLLRQNPKIKKLYGDSAYDSEEIHEYCYWKNIQTIIKPRKNVHRGFFRRKQMKNYSEKEYHQRSLAESGFSALKRKYGGYTFTKSANSVKAELYCKAIAYNLCLEN